MKETSRNATDLNSIGSTSELIMSTAETSMFVGNATSTQVPCIVEDGIVVVRSSSSLATWQGYLMFVGLAIVAFGVARGSLAVRHLIYRDKVRLYRSLNIGKIHKCLKNNLQHLFV